MTGIICLLTYFIYLVLLLVLKVWPLCDVAFLYTGEKISLISPPVPQDTRNIIVTALIENLV